MHELQLVGKKKVRDPNGPVLVMDFEDNVVTDLVNPTRTYTVNGNPRILRDNAKNGTGCLYLGESDILKTPRTTDLNFLNDFWFEVWGFCMSANAVGTSGGLNTILGYGAYPNAPGLLRWGLQEGKPTFNVPNGAADTPVATSATVLAYNEWHHQAVGRNGNTIYLFTDGQLVATGSYSGQINFGDNLAIGAYEDARLSGGTYAGFNGRLDRLRMYDKCLHTTSFVPSSTLY